MDDSISRQAAIELILSGKVGDDSLFECPEECNSFLEWAAEEVGKMPSAERKKGRWARQVLGSTAGYGTTVMYQCSNCEQMAMSRYNYCPNCGADMRGEEDG